VPIIFVTAIGTTEIDQMKGYELGAVDYLFVPVVPDILRAKVAAFVDLLKMRQALERQTLEVIAINDKLAAEIAERLRAEAEISELNQKLQQHARQLEMLNEELDAFAHSVSHDLRTPLAGLAGLLGLLEDNHGDRLGVDGRQLVHDVRVNVARMGDMIEGLLALARVGHVALQYVRINLSDLAHSVAADLQRHAPERDAEFAIMPGLIAWGDLRLLYVALQNLLGNAWKYTSKCSGTRVRSLAVFSGGGERRDGLFRA
jgi:signal transduction histidine kinase